MNETIEKYDKTELRVFASDVARLGAHIAERVEEKRKPLKGDWAGIEKRLDAVANELMSIINALDGGL